MTNPEMKTLRRQRNGLESALNMFEGFEAAGAKNAAEEKRRTAIEYAEALLETLDNLGGPLT